MDNLRYEKERKKTHARLYAWDDLGARLWQ